MTRGIELERQSHARRLEVLTRRLEKLNRDILETEIQIDNEHLIGQKLATKTRRFGLLAMLDVNDDEAEASLEDVEVTGELPNVVEIEATELTPA